jgi:hypothetical protein
MSDEELIQKAVQAYTLGIEKSLSAAARAYGKAPTTVQYRFDGRKTRQQAHENSQLLLEAQETQLVRWINELEIWGFPLRLDLLRDMASSLAGKPCGKNWPNRFIKRHNLTTIYSRRLDCNRAWNNDPIIISDWFKFFRGVREKYNIETANLYNMDEKGVILGIAASSKVIVSKKSVYRQVTQPGTCESVSIIECIAADGLSLPPFIIWKARQHQDSWYGLSKAEQERQGWNYAYSENGWTDNELGLAWLKAFNAETISQCKPGAFRMILMDNHDSHITWQFIEYALLNKIVLVCMPPHSTHLLQPLDVGIFSPLQHAYGRMVDNLARAMISGVNKERFLAIYPKARKQAITKSNILSAFKATGVNPISARPVLKRLPERQPTPQPTPSRSLQQPLSKTPQDIREFKALYEVISQSSSSRVDGLLDSPIQQNLNRLYRVAAQWNTDLTIQRNLNAQYEKHRQDKSQNRRMLSKGRVLGQDDVDRLKQEHIQQAEAEQKKAARQRLLEGIDLPELELASLHYTILAPSEAYEEHALYCHVFRCIALPARPLRLKWTQPQAESWLVASTDKALAAKEKTAECKQLPVALAKPIALAELHSRTQKRPPTCSGCGVQGHRINVCPNK